MLLRIQQEASETQKDDVGRSDHCVELQVQERSQTQVANAYAWSCRFLTSTVFDDNDSRMHIDRYSLTFSVS
jgi:hypothetical protein